MADKSGGKDAGFFRKLLEVDPLEARMQEQLRVGVDDPKKAQIANNVMSAEIEAIEDIRVAPGLKDNREELLKIARRRDLLGAATALATHEREVHEVATEKPWWLPIPKSWWKYLNQ